MDPPRIKLTTKLPPETKFVNFPMKSVDSFTDYIYSSSAMIDGKEAEISGDPLSKVERSIPCPDFPLLKSSIFLITILTESDPYDEDETLLG